MASATGWVPQHSDAMAKSPSQARRTNRALVALVLIALATAGAAAGFGPSPAETSSSSTLPEPTNSHSVPGARPAETGLSWFDHGLSVEQFDYEMNNLSCEELEKSITPDFCAVIGEGENAFMAVGTEGFWDPEDTDSEGDVWIPMNITMFSLRTDNNMKRAVSVLDGLVEKQYTSNRAQIDLYAASLDGVQVLVLHKHLSAKNADPYDLFDEMQVIAASPTGAPTVVATYRGPQIAVQATTTTLEFSTLRYRPTADSPNQKWYSHVSLSSSDDSFGMTERITSSGTPLQNGKMLTKVDSYVFPVGRGASSDSPTA